MDELKLSGNKYAEILINWGRSYWMETCFDRAQMIKPCPLGATGACCSVCHLGPCRFTQSSEDRVEKGVCGDRLSTVAARNLLRMATMGAGVYITQAREMASTLYRVANEETGLMTIKDTDKLYQLAEQLNIRPERNDVKVTSTAVAEALLSEIGRQHGESWYLMHVPEETLQRWRQWHILPEGIERELSEAVYRCSFGVEHELDRIVHAALRVSLAALWGGSLITAVVTDIVFGQSNFTSEAGFGILKEDEVNIVVAGHNPVLLWSLLHVASMPDIIEFAKSKGAKGVNISNIFCMKHGTPHIGGLTNQEVCLLTGLVDAVVLDTQCIMPSIVDISYNFHTKVISTSPKAHYPGTEKVLFEPEVAVDCAKRILEMAIENFPNRTGMGERVTARFTFQTGYTEDYLEKIGNSVFYKNLAMALREGEIKGIACIVGCDNPRLLATALHTYLAREFINEDILILSTGCASSAFACTGVMESALEEAGPGLKRLFSETGVPPLLHMGSCDENARILMILSRLVSEYAQGDLGSLPAVVLSPEWVTEKEITMAFGFAASGIPVIMGGKSPVKASEDVNEILKETLHERFKGSIVFEEKIERMFDHVLEHIEDSRKILG